MAERILIIEDDPKTVELVRMYLVREGYAVFSAANGRDGLAAAREIHPDLLILDLMLPGLDGLTICRTLRNEADVPIIMLTARAGDEDKLTGLNLGADDYITKPFSPRELAARVRTIFRRLPGSRNPAAITHGPLAMDLLKHRVSIDGADFKLTAVEFKLLAVMAKEPGRVFSREHLIRQALGHDFEGFDRTVDTHIGNLRKKLRQDGQSGFIKTMYGLGYKFETDPEK